MKSYNFTNRAGGGFWIIAKNKAEALKQMQSFARWSSFVYTLSKVNPVVKCQCGRLEDKEVFDSFGECINCDHVRGDTLPDFDYATKF